MTALSSDSTDHRHSLQLNLTVNEAPLVPTLISLLLQLSELRDGRDFLRWEWKRALVYYSSGLSHERFDGPYVVFTDGHKRAVGEA